MVKLWCLPLLSEQTKSGERRVPEALGTWYKSVYMFIPNVVIISIFPFHIAISGGAMAKACHILKGVIVT